MPRDGTINGIGLDEVNCIDCTRAELKDIMDAADELMTKYAEFRQAAKTALRCSQYKAAEDMGADN